VKILGNLYPIFMKLCSIIER